MESRGQRPMPKSRSNTAHSFVDRYNAVDEEPPPPSQPRPTIKTSRTASHRLPEPATAEYEDVVRTRPNFGRSTTFEGPTQLRRDISPADGPRMSRIPSDTLTIRTTRSQLRTVNKSVPEDDIFNDRDDSTHFSNSSPDRSYGDRSVSPATSHGSLPSGAVTSTTMTAAGKKGPPPPPPSRAKKPPPPPPPAKRSILV